MDRRVANLISLVVTGVWAISFIADIAMASYSPSPYIHAIMMTIAGAAAARGALGNSKDSKDK